METIAGLTIAGHKSLAYCLEEKTFFSDLLLLNLKLLDLIKNVCQAFYGIFGTSIRHFISQRLSGSLHSSAVKSQPSSSAYPLDRELGGGQVGGEIFFSPKKYFFKNITLIFLEASENPPITHGKNVF